VVDGETGFLAADEREMAVAVGRLGEIDPARCRSSVRERFDIDAIGEAHERAYTEASVSHTYSR
jgi:hypothetical protein